MTVSVASSPPLSCRSSLPTTGRRYPTTVIPCPLLQASYPRPAPTRPPTCTPAALSRTRHTTTTRCQLVTTIVLPVLPPPQSRWPTLIAKQRVYRLLCLCAVCTRKERRLEGGSGREEGKDKEKIRGRGNIRKEEGQLRSRARLG